MNLNPDKACNFNCIYCQLGRSVPLVNQRRNYILPETILAEVQVALFRHRPDEIDWITLPTTMTFDGPDRLADWPSKTRTFSIRTAVDGAAGAAATATVPASAQAAAHTRRNVERLITTLLP